MNKYKYIFGTCNFPSATAAARYYQPEHEGSFSETVDAVKTKLKEKSIAIGRPTPRADEEVIFNEREERYYIGVLN